MARSSRFLILGVVCHVVARGVDRMRIFTNGFEKKRYMAALARIAAEEKVLVHAYCLMHNHVHFLLTPTTPSGLARLFLRLHTSWAMYFNRKHKRTGHLFQNRYHSTPLDDDHYWTALRYVELNPRRAGLVENAEDWEFSSARAHLNGTPDPHVTLAPVESRRNLLAEWREFMQLEDRDREIALRRALPCSRPCGSVGWIQQLEEKYRRKLHWSPPGRPKAVSGASAQSAN